MRCFNFHIDNDLKYKQYFINIKQMELPTIIQKIQQKPYCCYRHFIQGKKHNNQTHCYSHVQLGLILPDQPIFRNIKKNLDMKATIKSQKNKIIQDQLQINGKSIKLKNYGYNLNSKDKVKKSLPQHLYSPFVYVDKVYNKKQQNIRPLQHQNNFLVTAQNSCHRHFKYDIQVQEKLKGMTKQQRRQFFQRQYDLTENLYYFYNNVGICLLQQKYKDKIAMEDQQQPNLKKIFIKFCSINNIPLQNRHQLMMIDQNQFKKFIKSLGFQQKNYKLIDQFWKTIFKQKIFQDYKIQQSPRLIGSVPKKISNIISMKAFFYNYNKFYEKKQAFKSVFSPNTMRQRNIDLRFILFPWKSKYSQLKLHLKQTKKLEFEICQKLQNLNPDFFNIFSQCLQQRNLLILKTRSLSKMLYPLVCEQILDFNNVHIAFENRIDKITKQMNEFTQFLNQFKIHRRQIASREQRFNEQLCKATDIADFLAYSSLQSKKSQIIIRWMNKFYKYLFFFKEEESIQYNLQKNKTILKKNLCFNYDQITQFLHYKRCKLEDQYNILNQYLIKLQQFYQDNLQNKNPTQALDIYQKNIVAQFTIRYLKINLISFQKINAVIKIIYPYLNQNIPAEILNQIQQILEKNQPSPYLTMEHLFNSEFIFQNNNCQACITETSLQQQGWRNKINKKLKIFQNQAYMLEHILVDWQNIKKNQKNKITYPDVKIMKQQQVQIQQSQQIQDYKLVKKQQQKNNKDFAIRYVEIPKAKTYKVNVTKHLPIIKQTHTAKSIIFEQQKNITRNIQIKNGQKNINMTQKNICKICNKLNCNCQTDKQQYCYICMLYHNIYVRCNKSLFMSQIKTVSDLQDQIFKLLEQI